MKFKAAIFDVDGVIIDTAHIHHLAWEEVFKNYGINKFTFRDFKLKIDGMPREMAVKKIIPRAQKADIEKMSSGKQKFFEYFLKKEKVKVFGCTVRLIKKLKKSGYKVGMASSSRNAKPILKKLGIYGLFDADAEGAYVKKGKPFPDIFLRAARRLRVRPGECVVFEDAKAGLVAAKKAGMKSVGVARKRAHELKSADIVIRDMNKVTAGKLKKLFR